MVDIPDVRLPQLPTLRPIQPTGPVTQNRPSAAGKSSELQSTGDVQTSKLDQLVPSAKMTAFPVEGSGAHMPISILSDAVLTRAEWGWRRFLADFIERSSVPGNESLVQGLGTAEASLNTQAQGAAATYAQVVAAVRGILDEVARMPAQRVWKTDLPGVVPQPQLVPFSHIDSTALQHATTTDLHPWALLDRVTTAVQDAQAPLFGGGILVVPLANKPSSKAVRWKAHRSSHADSKGNTVHRLVFELRFRDNPARITVVSMQPQLAIHLESDDVRLTSQIETGRDVLHAALNKSGWTLHNLTAGPYQQSEG